MTQTPSRASPLRSRGGGGGSSLSGGGVVKLPAAPGGTLVTSVSPRTTVTAYPYYIAIDGLQSAWVENALIKRNKIQVQQNAKQAKNYI